MLGYIARCKKLVFQLVRGLVPLVLIVPTHVRAQTQPPPPTDRPKRARGKAAKKQSPERVFVLVGAGDIASCKDPEGARATAKLIAQIPGTVFAAGDLAYEKGSAEEFKNCYDPAWGRFKDRTKPALGNHEYVDPTASGYFRNVAERGSCEAPKRVHSRIRPPRALQQRRFQDTRRTSRAEATMGRTVRRPRRFGSCRTRTFLRTIRASGP